MNKKNRIINAIYSVIAVFFIFVMVIFVSKTLLLNILPDKYLFPFILVTSLIVIILSCLLLIKKVNKVFKIIPSILAIFLCIVSIIGSNYINKTYAFMNNIKADNIILEDYYVVVRKDSFYYNIDDIKDQTVTTFSENTRVYELAKEELSNKISIDYSYNNSIINMASDLLSGSNNIILISKSHMNMINEKIPSFVTDTRIINTISTREDLIDTVEPVEKDIFSQNYTIFISGMDDTGDINNRSVSLVNVLVTVNPVNKETLITYIPKNYYVTLSGTTNKDTINNVGLYGISKSINTVKDLLNVQVNYYVKANYNTLRSLVNLIDGVVINDILMMGDDVVTYSRISQDNLEDAINKTLTKLTTTTDLFTKYTDLLDSISSSFETNINIDNITSLVKMQLDYNTTWNTKKYELVGSLYSDYTYTYGNSMIDILEPSIDSVKQASLYINGIIGGSSLSSLGLY